MDLCFVGPAITTPISSLPTARFRPAAKGAKGEKVTTELENRKSPADVGLFLGNEEGLVHVILHAEIIC